MTEAKQNTSAVPWAVSFTSAEFSSTQNSVTWRNNLNFLNFIGNWGVIVESSYDCLGISSGEFLSDFMAKPQTVPSFHQHSLHQRQVLFQVPEIFHQLVGAPTIRAAPTRVDFSTIFISISWDFHRLHKQDVYEFIEETYEFVASVVPKVDGISKEQLKIELQLIFCNSTWPT